ncbi:MAG: hypothetical protein H6883_00790 [Rhodobiaceae bacterium]|nr:hypothetical protein [Rhodobiaceae bacterium]MCC0054653.1 hypothetical protein [Rhodobiaceae bacterium]
MRRSLLANLRRRGNLIGQLLAVIMMLQPVATVLGADIAARDPLAQAALSSLCSPSGGAGPVSGNAATPSCCLPGGTCAAGPCGAAIQAVAIIDLRYEQGHDRPAATHGVAQHARALRWPQPTGPPIA